MRTYGILIAAGVLSGLTGLALSWQQQRRRKHRLPGSDPDEESCPIPTGDLPPDAADELRLLRAEIAALRGQLAPELPPGLESVVPPPTAVPRYEWLPRMTGWHLTLPERHYRLKRFATRAAARCGNGTRTSGPAAS